MHCISPPTKPKVPLNSLSTPEIGQRLPRGRQAMAGGLWATVWDCGCFGSVAKAMALANPNARLGGKGNALHFPAHRDQGAAGLSQHAHPRPSPAWAGEDRLPRGRQAMAGGFGHRLGLLMQHTMAKAMALAKSSDGLGGSENACVFPPTKIKEPLDSHSIPIKGQRPPMAGRALAGGFGHRLGRGLGRNVTCG